MRFENVHRWSAGRDGYFYVIYDTKEEALREAKALELGHVGQVYSPYFEEADLFCEFEDVFDTLSDLIYDEVGDASDYVVADKYQEELMILLAKTAIEYINEHKLQPDIFVVRNIEDVK